MGGVVAIPASIRFPFNPRREPNHLLPTRPARPMVALQSAAFAAAAIATAAIAIAAASRLVSSRLASSRPACLRFSTRLVRLD